MVWSDNKKKWLYLVSIEYIYVKITYPKTQYMFYIPVTCCTRNIHFVIGLLIIWISENNFLLFVGVTNIEHWHVKWHSWHFKPVLKCSNLLFEMVGAYLHGPARGLVFFIWCVNICCWIEGFNILQKVQRLYFQLTHYIFCRFQMNYFPLYNYDWRRIY